MLASPRLCSLPHDRSITGDMSCQGKEQRLYLESQQTEKMVDLCPKEPSCLR